MNIDRNKVYGTPSEAQDFSMSELIRHKFEDEWIQEQLTREEADRKKKEKKDALRCLSRACARRLIFLGDVCLLVCSVACVPVCACPCLCVSRE